MQYFSMTDESEMDLPSLVSHPISFLHMVAMVLGFMVMVASAPEYRVSTLQWVF
jgi:hypothetical protein